MMHFLGCLLVLLFAAVFLGLAFIGTIINAILSFLGIRNGDGNRRATYHWHGAGNQSHTGAGRQQSQQQTGSTHSQTGNSAGRQTQKIFEKDDSEYVDYEEIR